MADDKNFTIDTDDTVMFKERKRLLFSWTSMDVYQIYHYPESSDD